jgi:hypothetical protein
VCQHVSQLSYTCTAENYTLLYSYVITSGFWTRVRIRALCAPLFFGFINTANGALSAPLPIAALLLLIYPKKKNIYILCPGFEWAARVKGFPKTKCFPSGQRRIAFHWTTEALKYNIPRPSPHKAPIAPF